MFKLLRMASLLIALLGLIITASVILVSGNSVQHVVSTSLWLVFESSHDGDWEIYRMRPNGTQLRRLTISPGFDGSPEWSPDGQWIAFISERNRDPDTYWKRVDYDIYQMRPDGSEQQRLTTTLGRVIDLAWSPDGQWIAFTTNDDTYYEIYRMRSDGSDIRQLTRATGMDTSPQWSPDSQWIAFESWTDDGAPYGNKDIYRMRADGSDIIRLTTTPGDDWNPLWSPDGQWIVFVSKRDGPCGIYRVRPDGTDQQCFTAKPAYDKYLQWSPDHQWIAYVTYNWEVYRMRADGSERQLLANLRWATNVTWLPDGQHLAFWAKPNDRWELYQMRADGSNQQRLTTIPDRSESIRWSPPLKQSWQTWWALVIGGGLVATALVLLVRSKRRRASAGEASSSAAE